jgi:hypothetical protein
MVATRTPGATVADVAADDHATPTGVLVDA